MDETKYKRWQALHRQSVTGEPLNEAEQAEYEAACREMDEGENLDGDLSRLRELRLKILEADAEKQRMEMREAELDAKIAALEARLDSRTRQLLGIGGLSGMAHPKLTRIQEIYNYRCGYCGVSETDTGSELTVDHYEPVSAGGEDSKENLVYACMRCNQHKGAALPFASGLTPERRILHPLRDDFAAHIEEDESGRLHGRTATGVFHIQTLHLNRPALIANRRRRHLDVLREARLEQALALNAEMRARLEHRENYIASLEERLTNLEARET